MRLKKIFQDAVAMIIGNFVAIYVYNRVLNQFYKSINRSTGFKRERNFWENILFGILCFILAIVTGMIVITLHSWLCLIPMVIIIGFTISFLNR